MTNFDFTERILALLQAKQYVPLQRYLETLNPADIAECMIDLLDDEDLDTACATIGGWATEMIGAMPVPFDAFDFDRFTIMVKEVDENHRITRLLILEHLQEEEA